MLLKDMLHRTFPSFEQGPSVLGARVLCIKERNRMTVEFLYNKELLKVVMVRKDEKEKTLSVA